MRGLILDYLHNYHNKKSTKS